MVRGLNLYSSFARSWRLLTVKSKEVAVADHLVVRISWLLSITTVVSGVVLFSSL